MCLSVHQMNASSDFSDRITEARPVSGRDCADESECKDRAELRKNVFVADLLALSTQYTRKSVELMLDGTRRLKSSVSYK